MSIRLAVDFGGTSTDIVWQLDNAIERSSLPRPREGGNRSLLLELLKNQDHQPEQILVTGGQSAQLPHEIAGRPITHINEIQAIAAAGRLSREPSLVVSMGTGTAMVYAARDRVEHAGGTGLGGGTIMGLGRLLLSADTFETIEQLAEQGYSNHTDWLVRDIIGGDLGWLKGDYVAANFGRLSQPQNSASPADIAAGLLTMVGQSVAYLAIEIARRYDSPEIVVIGHSSESPFIRKVMQEAGEARGGQFYFPDHARYAVCEGALHLSV